MEKLAEKMKIPENLVVNIGIIIGTFIFALIWG